jgi:PAS domain S-box-containing protein
MDALDHGQKTYHYDEELIVKDGSHLAVEVFVHKYYPAEEEEPFYYSFIVDITESKHTGREIDRRDEETHVRRGNIVRSSFLDFFL